jgi:hypothetical protein
MANKRILIVGSGPSVYGCLLALKDFEDLDVTIIDNSNINKEEKDSCIFDSEFKYSNRITTEDAFETETLELLKHTANVSKSFGGFSNVWGGTYDTPSKKTLEEFKKLDIDLEDSINFIEQNIPKYTGTENYEYFIERLQNSDLHTKRSKIAISKDRVNEINDKEKCTECGSYKWSCKNTSIWSSKKEILELIETNYYKYIPNAKLIKFEEIEDIVKCSIDFKDGLKECHFEKVFIGCGPIGTSIIALNSSIVNKVKFRSSDLIQLPYVKFKKTANKATSFADIFAYDENNNFYLQFYFYSKSVLKLAGNVIKFTNINRFFPHNFLNYFGGVFIYLDQDLSSNFELYKEKGKLFINKFEPPNKQKSIRKKIFKKLRKSGFYPINFLYKNLKYGKSYHYGSQFSHSIKSKNHFTDIYVRLNNLNNSYIIDASVLPSVNTGPVTNTIIANSYRIVSEVITHFENE